jgi:hypothetical protein
LTINFDGIERKTVVPSFKLLIFIRIEELKKITNNPSMDSKCEYIISNRAFIFQLYVPYKLPLVRNVLGETDPVQVNTVTEVSG